MRTKRLARIFAVICIFTLGFYILMEQNTTAVSEKKFSMSYVYFGNAGNYSKLVDSTGGSLDDISPSYFDINPDGSLTLTTAINDDFIKDMHQRGIRVTPFLSNHWDRQAGVNALKNRHALVEQVARAVDKYNLDGVNVDIENVTEKERDLYTDFVRLLRERLPEGKSLSVAVAPNPNNKKTGWQGSYDYAALAKYADYLMLMAYDQSYQGGPEGPVAPAQFVENSIKSALKEVPPEKLVLGLAFYGRWWKQGASYGGYGISAARVEELIGRYRGVVTYDYGYQSPKAVITITSSDIKPVVSGITLGPGRYNIWYENEQSIKYKLQLVRKYNLKGAGSWSLGQESLSTWSYYKLWLNGFYFKDAQGHWAVDSILNMALKGWMKGTSSDSFMPEAPLNRAQAAAILVRALGLNGNAVAGGGSFSDISGHWAEREINIARQYNLIQGIGDGKFGPDLPVTREQIATMIGRMFHNIEYNTVNTPVFSDVTPWGNAWSYDHIKRIASYGIIKGYPDGLFHPEDIITRAQMAAIMDRTSPYLDSGAVYAAVP